MDNAADQYTQHAAAVLGVPAVDVTFDTRGWDSFVAVCDTNPDIVVKYPRSRDAQLRYHNEAELLRELRGGTANVTTPLCVQAGQHPEHLVLTRVAGEPLEERIDTLDATEAARIGTQLGVFLDELHHRTEPRGLDELGHDVWLNQWKHRYHIGREALKGALDSHEWQLYDEAATELWATPEDAPRPCHGDLGWYNVLYDHGDLAVIDFADGRWGHPASDFAGLGVIAARAALEHYPANAQLRRTALLCAQLFCVVDVGSYLTNGVNIDTHWERLVRRVHNNTENVQ